MAFADADASTPAIASVNSGNVVAVASFTPPAGALLIAHAFHDTVGGNLTNTSAISDSGGGSWTVPTNGLMNRAVAGGQNGHVQVSYSVASGAAITVTSTGTNCGGAAGLYVRVVTGADAVVFDVALVRGGATASVVSLALAASVTDGARAFLAATDWNVAANMTAGAGQTAVISQGIGTGPDMRVYVGVTTAVISPAGTAQTMSTATPSAGNTWNAVAYELRPASSSTKNIDATVTTTATLTAAAASGKPVASTLTGTATITPAAASTKPVTAALTATATVTPASATAKPVSAAPTFTATITPAAAAAKPVAATLTAAATITAAAAVGAAPVSAAASATFAAAITAAAAAARPVQPLLAVTATVTAAAAVAGPGGALSGEIHGPLSQPPGAIVTRGVSLVGGITG